jgi:preprotein translocase subunit SecF
LFVGVAIGTYSSIFIATPLLVDLKNREPTVAALARRVEARRAAKVPRGDGTEDDVPTATVAASTRSAQVTESGERRQPQRQTRSQRRGGNARPPR